MARYQVIIAYDGTAFQGFQRQSRRGDSRTIQAEIETALTNLGWQGRTILFAGRTDTGVHAAGQVVAFDLDWRHSGQDLQRALNAILPTDIAVKRVAKTRDDFHPRYDATARRYCYYLYCRESRDPLRERFAWRIWPCPDLHLMQAATRFLVGTHNFAAFGTPPRAGEHAQRCVYQADWWAHGQDLIFEIRANAFLYKMIRKLVGYMVAIGLGKRPLESLPGLLADGQHLQVRELAPAKGLVLEEVCYPTMGIGSV